MLLACFVRRNIARAREAALGLIALCPDTGVGYVNLARIERDAGRRVETAAALRAAVPREADPRNRAACEAALAEMIAQGG